MPKVIHTRQGKLIETPQDSRCPNCDASMMEYIYEVDVLQVLLVLGMARMVQSRIKDGMDFTLANQVHVPSLPVSHGVKCRTTQASKLGLVVKVKGRGIWAITSRGFAGLRGEAVPARVKVFRNKIEERFENMITFEQAKWVHVSAVEAAISRNKNPRRDHRKELEDFNPEEWFQYGGIHQGKIF